MLAMPIEEASAKVRTGPPVDDDEDYEMPVWAGVLPISTEPGTPEPDPLLRDGIGIPEYVERWTKRADGGDL
jgi:hypothetical protein